MPRYTVLIEWAIEAAAAEGAVTVVQAHLAGLGQELTAREPDEAPARAARVVRGGWRDEEADEVVPGGRVREGGG